MLKRDKDIIQQSLNDIFETNQKPDLSGLSYAQQLKAKYSFHAIHDQIMNKIMSIIIVWILSCFTKYSADQFHQKMAGFYDYTDKLTSFKYQLSGFDFINDWEINHYHRYHQLLDFIRKRNKRIDRYALYNATIKSLNEHGWQVTEHEKTCFKQTIQRLYNILYHDIDSIA